MKNYHQDYSRDYPRAVNPLQNYYTNTDANAQIKKIKSTDCLPQLPKSNLNNPNNPKKSDPKRPFIEPGVPCDTFQEVISTTCVTQNGNNTYLIAKALKGPLLSLAGQQCNRKQPAKKPSKKIPDVGSAICGSLSPHLDGYSTITHEGLYRPSNEDKITIYLEENSKWFGVYDGHGGNKCSQFLKDRLHQIFFAMEWEKDIPTSLRKAFISAEAEWKRKGDNSGSCALVIFLHLNVCYAANLGDSRAVLISAGAEKCYQATQDHKPSNPSEQKRVIETGGKIYQTTAITESQDGQYDVIIGPLRVFPGRLSTTRTFGDSEAKEGSVKVVICEPEITSFEIDDHDMLVIGSDGLWDRFQNTEVAETVKSLQDEGYKGEQLYSRISENLLREAMNRGSTDNISLIVVGMNDGERMREPRKGNEHIKILSALSNTKKRVLNDKENNLGHHQKMKEIDSKIMEINRSASLILQQSRRS